MDAKQFNERELVAHSEQLLKELGIRVIAREVKIGAYKLDAVAEDSSGALIVIEFKINASTKTLGQLLLYPHALRTALSAANCSVPRIRALLVTTFLDSNVQEVARNLGADIEFLVCTGAYPSMLMLAAPESVGPAQFWDQSTTGSCKLEQVLEHLAAGSNNSFKPNPLRGSA